MNVIKGDICCSYKRPLITVLEDKNNNKKYISASPVNEVITSNGTHLIIKEDILKRLAEALVWC